MQINSCLKKVVLEYKQFGFVTNKNCNPVQDEDLEKFLFLLANQHAIRRRGAVSHKLLGAHLCQAFRAVEARVRDRDWMVGWQYSGLEDLRPRPLLNWGLCDE